MSRKHIIVEIDEHGNCSVEGKGFKGPECDKFLEEVSNAIGRTTHTVETEEHVQRDRTRVRRQQRTGR